ncbi:CoB--CoM heterodisulfide reductase subunit B [candidate division WOR-3 bacterium]|nr:CoB--CoM heterodisulfide reductase subunit B [candidate division WOR-3 bacterium]
MEYALFLGCTVPARARNYELSTRRVAEALGIRLVDLDGSVCCGFPIKSVHYESFLLTAAKNLILAEEKGLDICGLCSACTSMLTEVNKELGENEELRKKVLRKLGIRKKFRFSNSIRVKHFARILYEDVGIDKIKSKIQKELAALKISAHYGCHYLKPSDIYDNFDDPEHPKSLDELIEATGAVPVDYENKNLCCGAGTLAFDENISFSMANKKLSSIKDAGADAISLICPFCSIMYDNNQPTIESKFSEEYNLPVLYYPQLLGLALGMSKKELGFNMNRVKVAPLIEKLKQ